MSIVHGTHIYRFGEFTLDAANRQLLNGNQRLDLNSRYFDALVLLVREQGRLVDKDRFFEEVWDDVVVSDSALTQCIKEIRRQLEDDVAKPRFIETVPRHGYRFIAEVAIIARNEPPEAHASSSEDAVPPSPTAEGSSTLSSALASALAGAGGGAMAGVLGGLLYGLGLAQSSPDPQIGNTSVLLVLIALSGFVGVVGGFGVGAGIAAAEYAAGGRAAWRMVGAVLGGLLVGGSVKLLGVDAFNLLLGQTPAGITGGVEGAARGLAVGLGAHLGGGFEAPSRWRPVVAAAATGAVAGVLIAVSGGHLLGGSLDLLAQSFSDSRITLDAFGRYFGEVRFGRTTQIVLAGIEGLIFAGCVVGAFVASRTARRTAVIDR